MIKRIIIVFTLAAGTPFAYAQSGTANSPAAAPTANEPAQTRVVDWKERPAGFSPLTMHARTQLYFKSVVGVPALLRVGVGSGLSQLENYPREWGRDGDGFARRLGTSFAANTSKQTTAFILGAALKEDDRYFKSPDRRTSARIGYAALSPLFARGPSGTMRPAVARVAGSLAGGFVPNAWMPDRVATVGQGFERAGLSLAYDALGNLLREFWPKRK